MLYRVNDVHYNVRIEGKGPPLLLLHGFTGSLVTWTPFIPAFSKEFTTIAVDLIGHGQTDAPHHWKRYTITKAADDLDALLRMLNVDTCHVLGYSMGGRLALMLACRFPNRIPSLILESSSPGLQTEQERNERRQADERLANFIERQGIEEFIHYWENIPLFQTQKRVRLEKRKSLRSNRLKNQTHGLANSLRGMGTGSQPSLWSSLPTLPMPVLLLAGAQDTKYVNIAQAMKKDIQQAQLEIVQDAGHTIHFEKSDQFSTLVLEFLLNQL